MLTSMGTAKLPVSDIQISCEGLPACEGLAILHMILVSRTQAMPGIQGVLDSLGNLMQIENGDLRVLVRSATQVYMKYCAYLNGGPMKLHRLTFAVRP